MNSPAHIKRAALANLAEIQAIDIAAYGEANASHYNHYGGLADCQNKGIGRLTMQKILDTAESLGLDRTKLEVRTGNDAAVHLYKSFGFVVEEYKEKYYDDGEDGYIMWRYNQS